MTLLLALIFGAFYFSRVIKFGLTVRRLWEMHEFYTELLEIPEVSSPVACRLISDLVQVDQT